MAAATHRVWASPLLAIRARSHVCRKNERYGHIKVKVGTLRLSSRCKAVFYGYVLVNERSFVVGRIQLPYIYIYVAQLWRSCGAHLIAGILRALDGFFLPLSAPQRQHRAPPPRLVELRLLNEFGRAGSVDETSYDQQKA